MSRIVFKNLDGSVGIIVPAENTTLTVEEIAEKDVPSGLSYRITDESNIPVDRTFRAAWVDDNPTESIDVDMSKARDLHMSRLRELRNKKFEELGFSTRLAPELEEALVTTSNKAKLRALRDMPDNTDLEVAKTPEDLRLIIPKELR